MSLTNQKFAKKQDPNNFTDTANIKLSLFEAMS